MKILFVTDYFYPHIGGVEKLFTTLCDELGKLGHEVTYITWKYNNALLKNEIREGVRIIRIQAPSRFLFSFLALPAIIREARGSSLIHTSTYSSALGAWVGAKLTNTKVVLTVHEVWKGLWKKLPFLSNIEKTTFSLLETLMFLLKFDHYIAVAESTKRGLLKLGIDESSITRIYNGIDYNQPKKQKAVTTFTFTYFGRAGVSKGLDLLINAAQEFTILNSDVCFKFIVSPQHPKVLKFVKDKMNSPELSRNSKLLNDLSFEQLHGELINSDCIVIPSYCEGFGFTAVEASALGIPIISSGKGSLPEVVSGKVITMEKYSTASLVEAMQLAFEGKYEEIPPKQFAINKFIERHLALYQTILSKQQK